MSMKRTELLSNTDNNDPPQKGIFSFFQSKSFSSQ